MSRVGVTTTPDRFEQVAALLRAAGLEPVSLPCLRFVPADRRALDEARERLARADLLLLTSARPVNLLWPGGMPDIPVAAVGRTTAIAVAAAGGRPVEVGNGGARELIEDVDLENLAVLYPHGDRTDQRLLELLRARCRRLDELIVYLTVPVSPPEQEVEAVIFASPSAVEGWLSSRPLDGDLVVAALGTTTGSHLAERGRPPDVVPDRPDYETLIDLLQDRLEVGA